MNDPLTVALISAGSAILASLLTIFLTPRLQHYFWKRQRRAELRLATINEISRLTAEFITNYIDNEDYRPSNQFFQSFTAAAAQLRALFSEATWQVFKTMEVMIGPNLGPQGKRTIDDFIRARDQALRALYREAGLL